MNANRRVAVVVPALDEEASIAGVVVGFQAERRVERVVVVDNASRDRTAERAEAMGATVVREERRGYGAALRAGIEHALAAGCGIVVLAEADGTFEPREVNRLLEPLGENDLVLGSRKRAMHGALRHGNRAMALVINLLWPRARCTLTDVGCTYRAFTAAAWERLRPGVRADGPEFSPQMIAEAFRRRLRTREVAVSYGARRDGASKHTGSTWAAARTAARMLRTIVAKRLERRPPP